MVVKSEISLPSVAEEKCSGIYDSFTFSSEIVKDLRGDSGKVLGVFLRRWSGFLKKSLVPRAREAPPACKAAGSLHRREHLGMDKNP